MKYCEYCGCTLPDRAPSCPFCGAPAETPSGENAPQNQPYFQRENPKKETPAESSALATAALVCSLLVPIAGLICGIVGLAKYQTSTYKSRCTYAVVISIASWIFSALFLF